MPFPPSPGGYVAFADDLRGTMIEVIPSDVQLVPGLGLPDKSGFTKGTITMISRDLCSGNDRPVPLSAAGSRQYQFPDLYEESIKAIAKREGWRCLTANRGRGLFQSLFEFSVEDRFMIEVNTPEMTAAYVELVNRKIGPRF